MSYATCPACGHHYDDAVLREERRQLTAAQARVAELEAQVAALRQAHWDGRAIGGFDNDGDPTPAAVTSDFPALIRSDWTDMRSDLDAACKDAHGAIAERDALRTRVAELGEERDAFRTRATEADALAGALILCSKHIGAELPCDCPTRYYTEVAWQVEEHIKALRTRAEKAEGDARFFLSYIPSASLLLDEALASLAKQYEDSP
jgi:hypothetical protein